MQYAYSWDILLQNNIALWTLTHCSLSMSHHLLVFSQLLSQCDTTSTVQRIVGQCSPKSMPTSYLSTLLSGPTKYIATRNARAFICYFDIVTKSVTPNWDEWPGFRMTLALLSASQPPLWVSLQWLIPIQSANEEHTVRHHHQQWSACRLFGLSCKCITSSSSVLNDHRLCIKPYLFLTFKHILNYIRLCIHATNY